MIIKNYILSIGMATSCLATDVSTSTLPAQPVASTTAPVASSAPAGTSAPAHDVNALILKVDKDQPSTSEPAAAVVPHPAPLAPAPASDQIDTPKLLSTIDKQMLTEKNTPAPVMPAPLKTLPLTPEIASKIANLKIALTQNVQIKTRETQVINLPKAASQVLVTDPKIADVQLVSPTTLYIYGRSPGNTEVMVTSQDMKSAFRYAFNVKSDYRELEHLIKSYSPHDSVKVVALPDGLMLQGSVETAKMAEDLNSLALRFVGTQGNVLNRLNIRSSTQVNLRVKIAEVKRTVIQQLGVNWGTSPRNGALRVGLATGRSPLDGVNTAASAIGNFARSTASPILNGIGGHVSPHQTDISVLIDALAQENLATILAEPTLITRSGEEASFLAGGEFPYPVAQGSGNAVTVTFQFKQYGISLSFLPIIVGDRISLRVKPEVSELDIANSSVDSVGNRIPAIQTRRAESTMEMANGQSMVMAGLLSDVSSSAIQAFPGLADIPVLGSLFRSPSSSHETTELIIVVTPVIVEPIDNPQAILLPTQGLQYAPLMEQVLFGRITEAASLDETAQQPALSGNSGFYF